MPGMPPIPDMEPALNVRPLQGGSRRGRLRGRTIPLLFRRIFRPTGDTHQQPGTSVAPHDADRGSVSLWLVIFAFTTIALLVLVVDGGQTMNAKSLAADIAEQAARAAADDVNVGQLRGGTIGLGGNACDLKQGPAAQLVASYAAGVPGATATLTNCTSSVTDVGGNPSLTVTATVQLSVRPALPVPPFTTISATAQETAYLACGSADQREAC
jgi:Flp pilus assembly protein TadG